jgi:hypothetical protein
MGATESENFMRCAKISHIRGTKRSGLRFGIQITIGRLLLAALPTMTLRGQAPAELDAERMAVYNSLFEDFHSSTSLSNRTSPLIVSEMDKQGCLKGLSLEIGPREQQTLHFFHREH